MKHAFFRLLLIVLGLTIWLGVPAQAEVVKAEHVDAELVSEVETIQPGKPFTVALRLNHEEHWHTYWLNAGDSGLATTLDWKLPAGFTAGPIQWPFPKTITLADLVSYGYEGETFLLVQITPPADLKPGASVELAATAKWLICKEICLPGQADVKLKLPVAEGAPKISSQWSQPFTDTRAKLPITNADWKLQAAIQGDKMLLKAARPEWFKDDLKNVYFFADKGMVIESAPPQTLKKISGGYLLELKRSTLSPDLPTQLQGVLVSGEGWRGQGTERALKVDIPIEPMAKLGNLTPTTGTDTAATTAPPSGEVQSLWIAFVFAFIGGLILNLMPCVLPVISLKIFGFVKQAEEGHDKAWKHGLAFTFGVLASFWTLAGALLLLRAGGQQLGWGFQLQSPYVLIFLSSLLFLLGLNLFGVFELTVSVGGSQKGGLTGSFFDGTIATLVATPCSAPFMGSALGFAIAQPPLISLTVFTMLALGMAAPYLVLSASPGLLKFVPKPGNWMEAFKQSMGFLMMGTVVWLVWVFGQQRGGPDGIAALLMSFVLLGIGAWAYGRWGNFMMPARTRLIANIVAAIFVLGGATFAVTMTKDLAPPSAGVNKAGEGIAWEPFSPERLAELQAKGTPVFIDFTAAWCLSCKANEKVAFTSKEVQDEFKKRGIATLKADWTNRDEVIAKKLAEFGRTSVPLYVLYGKDAKQAPKILPEVITPTIVLDNLRTVN